MRKAQREKTTPLYPTIRTSTGADTSKDQLLTHALQQGGPPPYSITASAVAMSVCGIVSPRVFAVLRLMTNSKVLGCSTGRSAGFAPLRILSAYSAARLNISGTFGPYEIKPPASA